MMKTKFFRESRNLKTIGTALALVAGIGSGLHALADGPQPGFTPFDYFEFDQTEGIYRLHETSTPFLGAELEPLGTFEIEKVKFKQETSALFRTRTRDLGDICTKDPSTLEQMERDTAQNSCGTRVWAYRARGQIFFFKADREAIESSDQLTVFPLSAVRGWDRRIGVRQAQESILSSHVIRAFEVPAAEINRRAELREAARTNKLYSFCGATEPGQVVSTEARALAWNAGLILFGATLDPLYIVEVPKRRALPTSMKILQKESVSVLLMGTSTFTTEYQLKKVD